MNTSKSQYTPPQLIAHGTVEELTQGPGIGLTDGIALGSLIVP